MKHILIMLSILTLYACGTEQEYIPPVPSPVPACINDVPCHWDGEKKEYVNNE